MDDEVIQKDFHKHRYPQKVWLMLFFHHNCPRGPDGMTSFSKNFQEHRYPQMVWHNIKNT